MNDEEKVNLVAEEVQNEVGLRKNIDYNIGEIINGNYGSYVQLIDNDGIMLMGIGLWLVKNDGMVYCVNIPVDDKLWEDYDSHRDDTSENEFNAMKLMGV